jgi:hypothetical protein
MTIIGVSRAKALVDQITKDHGHISEEKMQRLEPGLREEFQDAFFKKDTMIGASIIAYDR